MNFCLQFYTLSLSLPLIYPFLSEWIRIRIGNTDPDPHPRSCRKPTNSIWIWIHNNGSKFKPCINDHQRVFRLPNASPAKLPPNRTFSVSPTRTVHTAQLVRRIVLSAFSYSVGILMYSACCRQPGGTPRTDQDDNKI